MENLKIQSLSASCVDLFKVRISELDRQVKESIPPEQADILETQYGRFNLWADNIGVFADGNGSLDYRLADHEDITTLVLGQLGTIQRHLRRLGSYKTTEGDEEQLHNAETLYEENGDDTDASDSTYDPSEDESQMSKDKADEAPLVLIIHAIHRLHRLSMAIRQSSNKPSSARGASEPFLDEDGNDMVQIFEGYILSLLQRRYKGADDELRIRIARANAERRRRFLYRRRHQKRLKGNRDRMNSLNESEQPPPARSQKTTFTVKFHEDPRTEKKESGQTGSIFSKNNMTNTTASEFRRSQWRFTPSIRSTPSTVKSAIPSTMIAVDSSFIPPAPKVPPGAQEFLCPYCYKIQPVAERAGRRWKQHFLNDLQPFSCVAEKCHENMTFFGDVLSWIRHMESHAKVFTCRLHPPREGPQRFHSEAEFDAHMHERHRNMSLVQRDRLKGQRSGGARLQMSTCPLCGFIPSKAPHPGASVANHELAYKELLGHISHCLHSVAMLSLLEADDIDDSLPSEPSLRVADESTQLADNVSLDFDRDWKFEIDDFRESQSSEPNQEVLESHAVPDFESTPEDAPYEWFFMFMRRPSYVGQENDPKLENFVRRMELQKVLSSGGAADPQLPCYQLPFSRHKDFQGRNEPMLKAVKALTPSHLSRGPKTITLCGPAGIGKTLIAQEYCFRFKEQYDAIFWIHADQEAKMANDFVKIALALGFVSADTPEARDHGHCRQVVRDWLMDPRMTLNGTENQERARWLLVFDHIIQPSILNDYWPTGSTSGSIIMTSRRPMPWNEAHYPVLPIAQWNAEDSENFLRSITKDSSVNGEFKLGTFALHSPMQLTFLARIINNGQYTLKEFMDASQENSGEQAVVRLHLDDALKHETDFAEWALESLSSKASSLLDVLSFMDPDAIVERMLMAPPDDIAILDYPITKAEYLDAREELMKYSFISKDKSKGLMIQRLVQDATRRRMSPMYYRDVFNTCVALINDAWPYQPFTWRHSINRWSKCEDLYPHIIRIRDFSAKIPSTDVEDFYGAFQYARLCVDVGWYCHERGRADDCESFCTIAERVTNALDSYAQKDPSVGGVITAIQLRKVKAEIHMNRGCTNAEMNRPEQALESHKRFNQAIIEELGDEHPRTDMRLAISFNEVGVGHMMNHNPARAEDCFKRSEEEMMRLDDFEPHKVSLPLVNRAACALQAGRDQEAEALLNRGLTDRVARFGQNDNESFITGRFYHGLGNVKLAQGNKEESLAYYEKAREHYKDTLGRGHHRTADMAVAIGRHHARIGDFTEAVDWFEKALSVYTNQDIYKPEKARVLFKRSRSLRKLGRDAEADQDDAECLKLFRHLVPNDTRPLVELADSDFDRLIVFWSR